MTTKIADRGHRWTTAVAAALAVLLVAAVGPALALAQTEPSVTIEYPTDPAAVVIHYAERIGEIGEADAGPSVTIYGDGRVGVHYPRYMRRAGELIGVFSGVFADGSPDRG